MSSAPAAPQAVKDRDVKDMLGFVDDLIEARKRIVELEVALERVLIGGNHAALLIGADHPPAGTPHSIASVHYRGANEKYEAWCCWNAIMAAAPLLTKRQAEESQ